MKILNDYMKHFQSIMVAAICCNPKICNVILLNTFRATSIEYCASKDVTIASVFARAQENFFVTSESGKTFLNKADVQSIDKKLL